MHFWPLSWRGRHGHANMNIEACPSVPDVTQSNSSETFVTLHDDSPSRNHHSHAVGTVTLQVVKPPETPQGLRARPSVDSIRRELLSNTGVQRDFLVQKNQDADRMLPAVPSRSWSMPSQPSVPLISGFYGQPTDFNAIESTRLEYGKTQTAVGSFVAMYQKQAVLPSSPHAGGYEADGSQAGTPFQEHKHKASLIRKEDWEEKKDDSIDIMHRKGYHPLKDTTHHEQTPVRSLTKRGVPLSPYSANVSLEASPSSFAKPYSRKFYPARPTTTNEEYHKFEAEQATKEIHLKFPSDQTHVSGMTQSVLLDTDNSSGKQSMPNNDVNNGWGDDTLLHQKVQNQRRLREELLLAVVERLQDDVKLVADVFKAERSTPLNKRTMASPVEPESILMGFSPETRVSITSQLAEMLNEMKTAQPEEFFLSPSQQQDYVQPHNELQRALSFCRVLVQIAVPIVSDESPTYTGSDGRWSLLPGLRSAMGIAPPEPPLERRGGDTSVFTLPSASAETPMTSNLSVSSTIPSSRQGYEHAHLQADAQQVRQAIQIVSKLLQKLSGCCRSLADVKSLSTENTVRITKDLKRYYQQLMAVDQSLLRSVLNAFELKILPPALSQLLSNDDEENNDSTRANEKVIVVPPPRVVRSGCKATLGTSPSMSCASSVHDLFSPQTMDMMSDKQPSGTVPEEFDDLRRQTGSADYDDTEERRDGPDEREI